MKEDDMMRLLKKNAFYFVYYSAVIFPLMALYVYFIRKEFSGAMVMFQGLWLILVVEGALAVSERAEDKTNGYDFLRLLPIKDWEIVLSKFLIVFLTTVFLVAFNYLLYLFVPGPVHFFTIGRIFVLISGIYALILAATSYVIIFRFGHANFVKFVWAVMVITMVAPVLIFESVILEMDLDIRIVTDKLSQFHWLIWIVLPFCSLALFYFLYQTALKAKVAAKG